MARCRFSALLSEVFFVYYDAFNPVNVIPIYLLDIFLGVNVIQSQYLKKNAILLLKYGYHPTMIINWRLSRNSDMH